MIAICMTTARSLTLFTLIMLSTIAPNRTEREKKDQNYSAW